MRWEDLTGLTYTCPPMTARWTSSKPVYIGNGQTQTTFDGR